MDDIAVFMMPVLILAAGASSRMRGRDKLAMVIDGVALLRRQAVMALEVSDDVRIALPPPPHPRYDLVRDLDVTCVTVPDAAEGMSASLRALFATLGTDGDHALILLADLPDITSSDLRTVINATETHPSALIWRGATSSGKPGHPMIVTRDLFDDFQSLTGDTGGQSIVKKAGDAVHLVPLKDARALQDLDTPEEWADWFATRKDAAY